VTSPASDAITSISGIFSRQPEKSWDRSQSDYPGAVCLEARGRRSSYAGGSASDQRDLVAEFARAIHLCASASGGAEVRACLSNIHCIEVSFFLCICIGAPFIVASRNGISRKRLSGLLSQVGTSTYWTLDDSVLRTIGRA
jgi:hypothetical protein